MYQISGCPCIFQAKLPWDSPRTALRFQFLSEYKGCAVKGARSCPRRVPVVPVLLVQGWSEYELQSAIQHAEKRILLLLLKESFRW